MAKPGQGLERVPSQAGTPAPRAPPSPGTRWDSSRLGRPPLTLFFMRSISAGVRVSALASTGTMFTRWCRALMNSTSRGRRLRGEPSEHCPTKPLPQHPPSWQRRRGLPVPVAEGRDEVDAAVDAVILDVLPVEATFITEILLKLLVDVVGHWLPAAGTGR